MTSKANKKTETSKKEVVEEVAEEVVEEEVVEEEPIVKDVPRKWTAKVWKLNEPNAKDVMVGTLMYTESTDELGIEAVNFAQHRGDMETLLLISYMVTKSDGTQIALEPHHDKLHFIKNLHLVGLFFKTFYVEEPRFFYEVE